MSQGSGYFEASILGPDGRPARTSRASNKLIVDWAVIACRLFGDGDPAYALRGFYAEFANLSSPDDTIDVPVDHLIDAVSGRSYFDALGSTPDRDYLRVKISLAPAKFLEDDAVDWGIPYNGLKFQASTDGPIGVHGKPFDSANNSKIYGLALVAAPNWEDPSQDLVYARTFYRGAEQLPKPTVGQVVLRYTRTFRI